MEFIDEIGDDNDAIHDASCDASYGDIRDGTRCDIYNGICRQKSFDL